VNQWNKEIRLIWPECVCLWVKPKTSVMNIFLYNGNLVIFQDLGLSNCGRFVIQNAYRLVPVLGHDNKKTATNPWQLSG
jgi:hypothetical protein